MALFDSSTSESLYMQKVRQQQVKRNLEQVKLETTLVSGIHFSHYLAEHH